MASLRRVYWDACTWIALIQRERILDENGHLIQDRFTMCRNVLATAERNQSELATSTFCLAEVCKNPTVKGHGGDRIGDYFEVDYIFLVNLDRAVSERARSLMMMGYSKLKPADACHLASAITCNAEQLHTFDDKLLALDGRIDKLDGTKLKICVPDPGGKSAPLLDVMNAVSVSAEPPPAPPASPTQAPAIIANEQPIKAEPPPIEFELKEPRKITDGAPPNQPPAEPVETPEAPAAPDDSRPG